MTARPCPVCRKPADEKFRPFCSRRCSEIDLGRWLKGAYVIPAGPVPEGEAENAADSGD